jgi:hypothetical protein
VSDELSKLSDNELSIAVGKGVWGAIGEEHDRAEMRRMSEQHASQTRSSSDDGGLGLLLLLAIPAVLIYLLVTALANGVSAIANESFLAPLFPRPGDSVARYVISVCTLLAILPGSLVAAAGFLRGRRLHFLRRSVLYPLAFVAVPAILFMTVSTTTADVIRSAS